MTSSELPEEAVAAVPAAGVAVAPLGATPIPDWARANYDPEAAVNSRATRWPRFFARTLDTWWEILVVIFAGSFAAAIYTPAFLDQYLESKLLSQLMGWFAMPFVLVLDAGIYRVFGNTPGKALLGIRVTTADGNKLGFTRYLVRDFRMWLEGWGLSLPIVSLFTLIFQSSRLGSGERASYDDGRRYEVRAKPVSFARGVGFVVFVVGIIALLIAVKSAEFEFDKAAANLRAHPDFSWENPVTKGSTRIDSHWKVVAGTASDGQPMRTFTGMSDRVSVVFRPEVLPEFDLHEFARAYVHNPRMHFEDGGQIVERDGQQVWQITGSMTEHPEMRASIEAVAVGDTYWYMLTVQTKPYDYTDAAAQELRKALWSTVLAPGADMPDPTPAAKPGTHTKARKH